ncbi:hypothetical protein QAD02_014959 [Eretmocerus hayati]|uniref:Uncharacterized protein n=1 Tax=Eretmocerus hayati TaxID=131215 RepID=A0ACC2P6W4_9HYME|nr:hypothetical protein QAD02_014959 [Eretmocerus hayati]
MKNSKSIKEIKLQLKKLEDINSFISNGESILHQSIRRYCEVDVIKYLLRRGSNVHGTTELGENVILIAMKNIKKNNPSAIKKLIQYFVSEKVDINASDNAGDSALHYLVRNCKNTNHSIALAELLVMSGAKVNTCNKLGETALHVAVDFDNSALSEYLISVGADVDIKTKQFKSALHISVENSNLRITELLIKNKASCSTTNGQNSLLLTAIKTTKPGKLRRDLVKILLDGGSDLNDQDSSLSTPLHLVLEDKDEDCAKLLIDYGCSLNCKDKWNYTPLRHAICSHLRCSVELLLRKGANPNDCREIVFEDMNLTLTDTMMTDAIRTRVDLSIVKLLWEFGVKMSPRREISDYLWQSARDNNIPLAKFFLSKGADVNFRIHGESCLGIALQYRKFTSESMIQLLIDHGADVIKTKPLDSARRYSRLRNGFCLISHLALMTVQNRDIGVENLQQFALNTQFKQYYFNCVKELFSMQCIKNHVPHTNYSLYNVLLKKGNELVKCVQNESLVNFIKSEKVSSSYPGYSRMLRYRVAQGHERLNLLNKGTLFFITAVSSEIPVEILTMICEQLSNEDLINLHEIHSSSQKISSNFTITLRQGRKRKYST